MMTELTWQTELQRVLDSGDLILDPADLQAFATDETRELFHLPDAAASPRNLEQLAKILAICGKHRVPVVARGGGSGVSGGALASRGGLVILMRHFNRILEIDHDNMTVTVEAGMVTGQLQTHLLELGLYLPPDPGSRDWCQIGGNLAVAAAGPKSVKYGAFREWVLNLEIMLPDGTLLWTGANVRKFAAGLNLTQLVLGSEGRLGLITKAVLRLIAAPTHAALLRLAMPSIAAVNQTIGEVFRRGLSPCGVEMVDQHALGLMVGAVGKLPAAYLWLDFEGQDEAAIERQVMAAGEIAEACGATEILMAEDEQQRRQLWALRRRIGPAVIESGVFRDVDVSFPRACLPQVVASVRQMATSYGVRVVIFGHVGDGNCHVQILRDQLDETVWRQVCERGVRELYDKVLELGGCLTGEHGIGNLLLPYLDSQSVAEQLRHQIKWVFDPQSMLNLNPFDGGK